MEKQLGTSCAMGAGPSPASEAPGSRETVSHQHRKSSAWQQVRQLSQNSGYANSCLLLGFNMLHCSKNNFLLDLIPLAGAQHEWSCCFMLDPASHGFLETALLFFFLILFWQTCTVTQEERVTGGCNKPSSLPPQKVLT